jgi:hypothetical protein
MGNVVRYRTVVSIGLFVVFGVLFTIIIHRIRRECPVDDEVGQAASLPEPADGKLEAYATEQGTNT